MTQPPSRVIAAAPSARCNTNAEVDHERRLNFARRIAFDPNKPAENRRLWCRLLVREGTRFDAAVAQDVLDRIGEYRDPPPAPRLLSLMAGLALMLLAAVLIWGPR